MRTMKLLCLALALAVFPVIGSGYAESLTSYEQRLDHIANTWTSDMKRLGAELTKAQSDLDALKKESPRPLTYDLRLAEIEAKIIGIKASIQYATGKANVDFGLAKFESSDDKEVKQANDYANAVSGRMKGVPLGGGISVQVSVKIFPKSGKIQRAGIPIVQVPF